MLKQRILTAIVLIPITLGILFYAPPPLFLLLTGLLALAGIWEWTNLMELKTLVGRLLYLFIAAFFFCWALFMSAHDILLFFAITFIWWLIAFLFVVIYPRASKWWGTSLFIRGLMGLFVLIPCWIAINTIRNQTDGIYALLFLFILIWGADTAAYFVGKKWGKDKLAPLVSPGKSKQGVYGALIFCAFVTLLALWLCRISFAIWPWAIILSVVTVMFSVVGDLFESMMKRQVGLKDSGRLLPGHGGLLDRIDSLTAAAPVFVFGGLLLGMYLD